jgi:hypothetical protein
MDVYRKVIRKLIRKFIRSIRAVMAAAKAPANNTPKVIATNTCPIFARISMNFPRWGPLGVDLAEK